MVDDQLITELLGKAQGGGDVIGPMTVLAPRDLLAQHTAERLELQVAVDGLALVLRLTLLGFKLRQVVGRLNESAADHRRGAKAGSRRLLALSVHPLGVLAECG